MRFQETSRIDVLTVGDKKFLSARASTAEDLNVFAFAVQRKFPVLSRLGLPIRTTISLNEASAPTAVDGPPEDVLLAKRIGSHVTVWSRTPDAAIQRSAKKLDNILRSRGQ